MPFIDNLNPNKDYYYILQNCRGGWIKFWFHFSYDEKDDKIIITKIDPYDVSKLTSSGITFTPRFSFFYVNVINSEKIYTIRIENKSFISIEVFNPNPLFGEINKYKYFITIEENYNTRELMNLYY